MSTTRWNSVTRALPNIRKASEILAFQKWSITACQEQITKITYNYKAFVMSEKYIFHVFPLVVAEKFHCGSSRIVAIQPSRPFYRPTLFSFTRERERRLP